LKTLRLRVKMEKVDGRRAIEPAAIVNSRFVSPEHEVLYPSPPPSTSRWARSRSPKRRGRR
jgi:hypothetical protein